MSFDEQYMDDCEQEQQLMNEQCHNQSDGLREKYRNGEISFSDYMRRTSEPPTVKILRKNHAYKLK